MITKDFYDALTKAYGFFNKNLFNRELPECLITVQRQAGTRGYYHAKRFNHRKHNATTDELALNPDKFLERNDLEVLSTLVHEMCHHWQEHCGNPVRTSYHNIQWAKKMESIGLMPSDTGEPNGKKIGQHMTHYIINGGRFEKACNALFAQKFDLQWGSCAGGADSQKKKNKTKYTCPQCGLNAWAKPLAPLVCGECELPMESQET